MSTATELRRQELRALVAEVWERLLGTEPDADDDFFELGGYSMLAMEMCQTLRDGGLEVAVIDLVRNSSLDAFVQVLAERNEHDEHDGAVAEPGAGTDFGSLWSGATASYSGAGAASGLVELSSGAGPAIHIVHWGTGNIEFLREYAAAMSGELPMVGVANPGSFARVRPLLSVGDLAAQYVRQILDRGLRRQVLLAGLCSGGYVAVEMARQLRQLGVEVPLVGLVNTGPPDEPMGMDLGAGLRELYEGRLAYLKTRFELADLDASVEQVLTELTARNVSYHDRGSTRADFYWLQAVWAALTFAQLHYVPRPYDGPVRIFQTAKLAHHYPADWTRYLPAAQANTYDASSTLPIIQHPSFPPEFRAAFEQAAGG